MMSSQTEQTGCGESASGDDRRTFFARISIAFSALIGVLITLPGIGFILAPVVANAPRKWREIGTLDRFPIGETVLVNFEDSGAERWAGTTAKTGAWVRRVSKTEFIAFSINCRHLGCPVRWVAEASLFMCPCHGGVYYEDGEVAAGPPPEALARFPVRLSNGKVEIETSSVPLTTNAPV